MIEKQFEFLTVGERNESVVFKQLMDQGAVKRSELQTCTPELNGFSTASLCHESDADRKMKSLWASLRRLIVLLMVLLDKISPHFHRRMK
jgi:hypothetical protein